LSAPAEVARHAGVDSIWPEDEAMNPAAGGFGRYRELILAAVFLVIASQELLEMWLLEPRAGLRTGSWPLSVEVVLHVSQVVAVITGTYIFIRAWQQRTALMDREVARSRQLGELVTALREKEDALAQAIEKLVFAQEQERRMIAYDVHDGLAQLIVSAKQHLDTCEDLWTTDPGRAAGELERGLDRMGRAVEEVRRLLTALRPSLVDPIGLVPAVRGSLDEVAREAGLAVTLTENLENARLPGVVETSAFRIVQEALANALKHSRTRRVDVDLRRDDDTLSITVVDHGVGFEGAPGETPGRGLGLLGMRERARLLGGECAIESAPDRGTCVRVRLPLAGGTRDAE
jgi:signal transduction histidine kinase